MSDRFSLSIVADPGLLDLTVELKLHKATVDEVMSALARQVKAQVTKSGGVYLVGQLRPEDRGALVRRVRRLDETQLRDVCQQMLSDSGRVSAFKDGLVIVSDTVEVLRRVSDLLDSVESAEAVTWCVQLHVVQLTDRDVRDLGLDTVPALDVAAVLGDASSGRLLSIQTDLTASLKSVLQFANEKGRSGVVAEPMFLLTDGETSTMNRTRRVPVENSFVNPESGVVSRTFTFQEVGLQFRVTLRELNWKSARTSIFISLGDIETAGVDGRPPITRQQELTVSADMAAGGVYLVGALRDGGGEKTQKGGMKLGGVDRSEQTETLVFARVARVASPLVEDVKSEGGPDGGTRERVPAGPPEAPAVPPVSLGEPKPIAEPLRVPKATPPEQPGVGGPVLPDL